MQEIYLINLNDSCDNDYWSFISFFFFFFDFIFEGISKLEELSRKTDVEIE